jgi:hypothetical protein
MSLAYSWKHCRHRFRWYFLNRKIRFIKYNEFIKYNLWTKPDETVAVAAGLAFPRPGSVLPRAGEPDVVVTHGDSSEEGL